MKISSLAVRTDLLFHQFDGEILDRGEYLVIRTPNNPDYWSGNALVFAGAPGPGDAARWLELFERELPGADHRAFAWDGDDAGDTSELVAAGVDVSDNPVLAMTSPPPARAADGVSLRPLVGDDDWRAVLELNAACDDRVGGSDLYDRYRDRVYARLRAMAEAGRGHWLGGFAGGRLVGQLGIYAEGELARFSSVETHPEFRRRGVCGALVVDGCRRALGELGARTVVIVADDGGDAERLYRRLGFTEVGREHSAMRRPQTD